MITVFLKIAIFYEILMTSMKINV